MRADEIERVRGELDEFVGEVFASLQRRDQRAKGGLYLRGLMLEGRRKSMQPMGDRLGIDYQQLQQFVSSSPWPVEPVRRQLARKATGLICPEAWVIDDIGFVKDGPASPGVARQYSGTLGKTGNAQIGVSIHAVTDAVSCPLDWRLFLPEAWDDTERADRDVMITGQIHRDLVRAEMILLAQPEDLLDHLRVGLVRLMMREAGAILEPLEALLLLVAPPLVEAGPGDPVVPARRRDTAGDLLGMTQHGQLVLGSTLQLAFR